MGIYGTFKIIMVYHQQAFFPPPLTVSSPLSSRPRQSGSGAVEPSTEVLEGTAGDSTVPIESEMRGSVSLELESSVSAAMPKIPEKAATMPVEPLGAQTVLQEGMLGRKHDLEGSGKKASNR